MTFLRERPKSMLRLPLEVDVARILCLKDGEVFTTYVRSPRGPVIMALLEKTSGANVTTRTWESLKKVAAR